VFAAKERALRHMAVHAQTLAALNALDQAAIPYAIIKGGAVARWYPHGWCRSYSDVDVVVRPRDFSGAVDLAGRLGWAAPSYGMPAWPFFFRWCREGANLHGGHFGNLDLHHHIAPWIFGRGLSATTILDRADQDQFLGRQRRLACAADAAVIAALHIMNDFWKGKLGLQSWRDLLVIGQLLGPQAVTNAFQATGCEWLLPTVATALAEVAPDSCFGALRALPTTRLSAIHQLRLRALGWHGDADGREQAALHWAARLPVAGAALYLAASSVPSPSFIRAGDQSYVKYWRRVLRGESRVT
jgi:hypothetical protein